MTVLLAYQFFSFENYVLYMDVKKPVHLFYFLLPLISLLQFFGGEKYTHIEHNFEKKQWIDQRKYDQFDTISITSLIDTGTF